MVICPNCGFPQVEGKLDVHPEDRTPNDPDFYWFCPKCHHLFDEVEANQPNMFDEREGEE